MTFNWRNRTLWTGDNLDVMRGMNSGSVDLIYLDPPFNSNTDYSAPIGSEAAGAAFFCRVLRANGAGHRLEPADSGGNTSIHKNRYNHDRIEQCGKQFTGYTHGRIGR